MKTRKRVVLLFIPLFLLLIGALLFFYFKNNYVNEPILKTAIHIKDLENTNYILCKRVYVTGFDWVMIANHREENLYELCNIVNMDPFSELHLTYEFF